MQVKKEKKKMPLHTARTPHTPFHSALSCVIAVYGGLLSHALDEGALDLCHVCHGAGSPLGLRYGLVTELGSKEAFKAQTLQCFQEMARAGITTVGEFHYLHHTAADQALSDRPGAHENFELDAVVVEAAREANVRLVLLSACYQRGGFDDAPLSVGQQRFSTQDLGAYWRALDDAQRAIQAEPRAGPSIAEADGQADRRGSGGRPLGGAGRGAGVGVVVHSLRAVGVEALKALAQGACVENNHFFSF